jgi:hypothetical protein
MAKGPDPNRWTPTESEAQDDEGLEVNEPPRNRTLQWMIVAGLAVLVIIFVVATA